MAHHYRGGDRTQAFLLPPDMGEWLEEDHLAWLILEFVEAADTSVFHAHSRRGGRGRAGFDPDVLLALLLYAYSNRVYSSRRIEGACQTDVACRVITGNEVPDHTVIARFRQRHTAAFKELFSQLLAVCVGEGMGQVGAISLDGTKIAADASRHANRTREQLQAEVDDLVARAEAVDAEEDERFGEARGDELADRLAPGSDRLERLRSCLEALDEDHPAGDTPRVERWEQRVEEAEDALKDLKARRAAYEAQRARGEDGPIRSGDVRPVYIERARHRIERARQRLEEARDKSAEPTTRGGHLPRRNPTDPDSRLMRSQGGYVQGYNAQAAVTADGLIVACEVFNHPNDIPVFAPMLDRLNDNLAAAGVADPVRAVLADGGYYNADNLDLPGPPRLIPPRSRDGTARARRMRRLLEQPAMARLYQRRQRVEGAFGRIKHNQGLRRFSRRGLQAANGEWHLACAAHNLIALHRRRTQRGPGTDP
jgi:transposase